MDRRSSHSYISTANIDVLVLCGGMGNRLRTVIKDRPKPMAEISGMPFLDILLEYVSSYGFKRFVLCTGYKGEVIEEYYHTKQRDFDILFSREDVPLGTGGAIKNAELLIKSNMFLVMNGDSICMMNMSDFLDFHNNKGANVSIALVSPEKETDYGAVTIDSDQKIIGFSEKTKSTGYISAGVYLFNREMLELIPDGVSYSLEYDYFPTILKREVYGYITGVGLLDIGTPERYERAKKDQLI